jgi:hypothetical protein
MIRFPDISLDLSTPKFSQMLLSNPDLGWVVLSNIFNTPRGANDFISAGAGLKVVYDVNTPNGARLAQVIRDAGYEERAVSRFALMQLGGGDDLDWNSIAQNRNMFAALLTDNFLRGIMFNSAFIMSEVLTSSIARDELMRNAGAFAEALANDTARAAILANAGMISGAVSHPNGNLLFQNHTAMMSALENYPEIIPEIITTPILYLALLNNAEALRFVFENHLPAADGLILQNANRFSDLCNNHTAHAVLLAHNAAMDIVANSQDRMNQIAAFPAAARLRFFDSASAMLRILASATVAMPAILSDTPARGAIVAESRNYLRFVFGFSEEWAGAKTAVFYGRNGADYPVQVMLEYDSQKDEHFCFVPDDIIQYPGFEFSVYALSGRMLITADRKYIPVGKSGSEGVEFLPQNRPISTPNDSTGMPYLRQTDGVPEWSADNYNVGYVSPLRRRTGHTGRTR